MGKRQHFAYLYQVTNYVMQMYVHETLYSYCTTIPQKMPHVTTTATKQRFAGSHSQVYYNNFYNRLFAVQSRTLIFTEVFPLCTNLQIPGMTLFYLRWLVSSVAAEVIIVNIRLLPSSTSDFYVTVSNKLKMLL